MNEESVLSRLSHNQSRNIQQQRIYQWEYNENIVNCEALSNIQIGYGHHFQSFNEKCISVILFAL